MSLYRSASAIVFASVLAASPARADEPKLSASMQCDRASEPGRLRCSVEAHAVSGRTLAWADVAIVDVPDFTTALKGRLGPSDATSHDDGHQRWAYGLVARKTGRGQAHARVRAVVCESADGGAPKCAAVTLDVVARVEVG